MVGKHGGVDSGRRDRQEGVSVVDMRLEVVVVPVSDVDRARDFYKRLGWRLDADFATGPDFRVVQVTPPGSACAVIFGTGITTAAPGSAQGLQLVVNGIDAARAELAGHGAPVSEVFHDAGGVFHHAGGTARVPGPAPEHQTYGSWVSFSDPDGNEWFVQEVTTRLPGRETSALAVYDSVAGLAGALRRAEAAHGKYEEETGQADPDWPDWYARYMASESARQVAGA
jgi:catechol 2,3-dioxygenase-like lactoylglutathione lyase family enzyme